jgi:hypothetical protein
MHCEKKTEEEFSLLCASCMAHLSCVSSQELEALSSSIIVFDYTAVAKTLVNNIQKYAFLEEGIAAFCIWGYMLYMEEMPDVITSIQDCTVCKKIAKQMSVWLQVPYQDLTKISFSKAKCILVVQEGLHIPTAVQLENIDRKIVYLSFGSLSV